jgi:hypothetical protein
MHYSISICQWCHTQVKDRNKFDLKRENKNDLPMCSEYCRNRYKMMDLERKHDDTKPQCLVCCVKDWGYITNNSDDVFCCGMHYDIYHTEKYKVLVFRKNRTEIELKKVNEELKNAEDSLKK